MKYYLEFVGNRGLASEIKFEPISWRPKRAPSEKKPDRVLAEATSGEERALILVLYSTGLRVRELLGDPRIRRGSVRVERHRLEQGGNQAHGDRKGGKEREVVFMLRKTQALEALREYLGERKEDRCST